MYLTFSSHFSYFTLQVIAICSQFSQKVCSLRERSIVLSHSIAYSLGLALAYHSANLFYCLKHFRRPPATLRTLATKNVPFLNFFFVLMLFVFMFFDYVTAAASLLLELPLPFVVLLLLLPPLLLLYNSTTRDYTYTYARTRSLGLTYTY